MLIPFLGDVTAITAIIAVVTGVFGYIIGGSVKHSFKIIIAILVLIAALYFFGFIGKEILDKIATLWDYFEPLMTTLTGATTIMSNLVSLPVIGFGIGFVFGLRK